LTTITSADITVGTGANTIRRKNMELTTFSKINSSTSATGTNLTYKITSEAMFSTDGAVRYLSMHGLLCNQPYVPAGFISGNYGTDHYFA